MPTVNNFTSDNSGSPDIYSLNHMANRLRIREKDLTVSGTALSLANMDDWLINFGGVEGGPATSAGSSGVVQANISHKVLNAPPVVIGPGQSALIYIWQISNSGATAGNLIPELGYWER